MSKLRSVVHVFHITKPITQRSISELAQKFNLYSRLRPAAVGIVVNLPNTSPVMVDNMVQLLKSFRQAHNIPIIGFTHQHISLQSYYLLSISDKIYTYPTAIYRLRHDKMHISMSNLYKKLNLKKTINMSNEKLFAKFLNFFPVPHQNTFQQPTYQDVDIGQRIFKQALKNREQIWNVSSLKNIYPDLQQDQVGEVEKKQINKEENKKIGLTKLEYNSLQTVIMGEDALKNNLVDGYGFYDEILRREFPASWILKAKYPEQNKSISKIIFMITSPIILIIFLIKVVVKWSIIFYAWLKSKALGMAGIQADSDPIPDIMARQNSSSISGQTNAGNGSSAKIS